MLNEPDCRLLSEAGTARFLSMSVHLFRKKKASFFAAGMPKPDPLFGNRYDAKLISLWLDERRQQVSKVTPKRKTINEELW